MRDARGKAPSQGMRSGVMLQRGLKNANGRLARRRARSCFTRRDRKWR